MQPKPWLPKSIETHRNVNDVENAEMQPEAWETRKQRTRITTKEQEMQPEAWIGKAKEHERKKSTKKKR